MRNEWVIAHWDTLSQFEWPWTPTEMLVVRRFLTMVPSESDFERAGAERKSIRHSQTLLTDSGTTGGACEKEI